MLNQAVLVGRIVNKPELKELENGRKVTNITLAVPRSFKNANGDYETDFLDCVLWKGVAESTVEYCNKGDLVGIKGRLQATQKDGKTMVHLVAEKVTFLSSKKSHDDDYDKEKDIKM